MSDQPASRIRWLLVTWLFVLSAVAFLDRVNLSVAATHLEADYHLSDVQFGALSTFFLIGYALFQTPAGWLADKWGPRRVLAGGVIWWGVFTALTASVPTTWRYPLAALILMRFLLGIGEAVVYPSSNQFIARWIPTQERGIANGLIFAGVGVGSAVTPSLVTFIILHQGWRFSFWVCARIGFAAGLVWFLGSRDTPEQHPRVSSAELAVIRQGLTLGQKKLPAPLSSSNPADKASGNPTPALSPAVPWSLILRSREVWAMTLSYFCYGYVAWIFFAWFFTYLARVRGLNLKTSAFYATLPFIAMAISCPLGGLISDWLTKRKGRYVGRCGVAVFGIALAGIFLAFGSTASSPQVASIVLAGGAGALYLSQSSFWSVSADIGGAFSGSVSGFMNMGAQFGGAVTASLTPAIAARFGWTASFLVAASLSILGALAWLFVNPNRGLAGVTERS